MLNFRPSPTIKKDLRKDLRWTQGIGAISILIQSHLVPRLRAPIVLVHGLFGFGRVQLAGYTIANYWPGVLDCLRQAGNRVLLPSLSPTGAIADRALQLKQFILRESPSEPVHLIAHSMGGLDARYMISRLGMGDKVLSLTTLGTPHHGSTFANWAIGTLEWMVKPVFQFLEMPTGGFYDLTTHRCQEFNQQVPNDPRVKYLSIGARHNGSLFTPEWLLPYHIVLKSEGENDGVVSLASSRHGEFHDVWEGDHFSLVNWLRPLAKNRGFFRDPVPRFGKLLQRLRDDGF